MKGKLGWWFCASASLLLLAGERCRCWLAGWWLFFARSAIAWPNALTEATNDTV